MSVPDSRLDTVVAGLRCRDVLDRLSDLLDGSLAAAPLTAIQAHLAECDNCTRFGGDMGRLLEAFRRTLHAPPVRTGAQSDRLHDALRRAQST